MASTRTDEDWMLVALAEADRAQRMHEVPVGCVLVNVDGDELASGHNLRETLADPSAHAEMVAIRAAASKLASWRLEGVTAFVTLEPCIMCAGALLHARVARVVYGCSDPKAGALTTLYSLGNDSRLNHRFEVLGNVLADECASRLKNFFLGLRAQGKK